MSKRKAQRIRPLSIRGRARTRTSNGLDVDLYEGPPLGPGMVGADPAAVLAALDDFDPDAPWRKVRGRVLPMLPRARPFPGADLELIRTMLPPGILVSFGIDLGPAVTFIGRAIVDRWAINMQTLVDASLANLRELVESCDERGVLRDRIGAVDVSVLQTHRGVAASLLLVPETIERFFGPGPHLLIAPMRDLLIALPPNVERSFAGWLADEFEVIDPNHLHLGGFLHERGNVRPELIDEVAARA